MAATRVSARGAARSGGDDAAGTRGCSLQAGCWNARVRRETRRTPAGEDGCSGLWGSGGDAWGGGGGDGDEKQEPASAPQEPAHSPLTASCKASTGAWSDPDEQ